MGIEIERRFLVDGRDEKPWRGNKSSEINQFYLKNVKQVEDEITWNGKLLVKEERVLSNITTWRIRFSEGVVTLTAKGRRTGASAPEFEWNIPNELYESLALDNLPSVRKTRYYWTADDGLIWEIDEFEGMIAGLIIAEVELESEAQEVEIPDWVGLEITYLSGWSNSSLSRMINDSKQN